MYSIFVLTTQNLKDSRRKTQMSDFQERCYSLRLLAKAERIRMNEEAVSSRDLRGIMNGNGFYRVIQVI